MSGENVFSRLSKTPSSTDLSRKLSASGNPASAISLLSSSDWEDKVNGLLTLSDLALRNSSAFANSPDNHSALIHAVIMECKNLRSQVSTQLLNCSKAFKGGSVHIACSFIAW